MPSVLVRTDLSHKDLRLLLSNEEGQAQDAFDVRWTIFDSSRRQISGLDLRAINRSVGQYYAPFHTDVRNGNYVIRWSIKEQANWPPKVVEQKFFVVDPSSYECCGNAICPDGVPLPKGLTYLCGTCLGPGDLPIHLRDDRGILTDALGVFWTIQDIAGNSISPRRLATKKSVGSYYAPWSVNVTSGNYSVLWEFIRDADSPMQSARLPFSVINPASPIVTQFVDTTCEDGGKCNTCGPCKSCRSCRPSAPCELPPIPSRVSIPSVLVNVREPTCSVGDPFVSYDPPCAPIYTPVAQHEPFPLDMRCQGEVRRIVHLATSMLPGNGVFTDQAPFNIPCGVKNITFYLTYTRSTPGGSAIFKLMWGNGTEESQETIVGSEISGTSDRGVQSMYLQDLAGPTPIDNNEIDFIFYTSTPGGAKTVRLLAAEAGYPLSPGTLGITLTASG